MNELSTVDNKFEVHFTQPEIKFDGLPDLKRQVETLKTNLVNYQVTDSNLDEAQTTNRKLNKLKRQINQRRIDITKQLSDPAKRFKKQVDDLIEVIDEAQRPLADQLESYKTKEQEARHAQRLAVIAEIAKEFNIAPEKIEFQSSWDNKSISKNKLRGEVIAQIHELKEFERRYVEGVQTVTQYADKLGLPAERWIKLLKTESLPNIIKGMDTEKEQMAELAKSQRETKLREIRELEAQGDQYIDHATGEVKETIRTIKLEVRGTKWQMQQLQMFLKDNAIEYRGI